jgi:hypothetical protein
MSVGEYIGIRSSWFQEFERIVAEKTMFVSYNPVGIFSYTAIPALVNVYQSQSDLVRKRHEVGSKSKAGQGGRAAEAWSECLLPVEMIVRRFNDK